MKNIFFAAAVLFLLSGCTTFSRQECEEMDWAQKGRQSSLAGIPRPEGEAFLQRKCTKEWGTKVDQAAFTAGYTSGLQKFCTESFLHQFGLKGGVYRGTCPKPAEEKVLVKFFDARTKYLEDQVAKLKSEVSDLGSEVSKLKSEKSDLEDKLRSFQ